MPDAINGRDFPAGTRTRVDLPMARLPGGPHLEVPVVVLQGVEPGPRVFLTGGLHGDELNGVEVIREVAESIDPSRLKGRLVAAPLVNVFGALHESRYLPDRRDLNRSFPGRERGSLASQLAHLLMTEVVDGCSWGIDLHTGSDDRDNLPQIRAELSDPEVLRLARAFGAPIVVQSKLAKGTLRKAASEVGCRMLLFETGEAKRFDAHGIAVGVSGVRRVLDELGLISDSDPMDAPSPVSMKSRWIRCPDAGFARLAIELGDRVEPKQTLGWIGGPFEDHAVLESRWSGTVIGLLRNPVVYKGDAVIHVALDPQ